MSIQNTITERVKFLIKYIIGQGVAKNQEDLGEKMGIKNKSYLSQLVNNSRPNDKFIDDLVNFIPNFNKEWLYNEAVTSPFIPQGTPDVCLIAPQEEQTKEEPTITELQNAIELLKKDVKYHADIADSRLQTINIQNKYIDNLEAQLQKK